MQMVVDCPSSDKSASVVIDRFDTDRERKN
jgi:hypothetical protein